MEEQQSDSFFEKIWKRKIPQYLGTYLAVGFGLYQFLEVLIDRYELDDSLHDRYMLVWFALIPAVFVLVYYGIQPNGKEAHEKKTWPKYFIIGNVVIALLLSIFAVNSSSSNEETANKIVELTDEEGKQVKVVVPSLKKVKSVALFQFENLTGDATKDWMGVAFSTLMDFNLEQLPEFYVNSSFELNSQYNSLGIELFTVPNSGMQREIAKKSRNDYYTKISFDEKDGVYELSGSLFRTKDSKSVVEINVKNKDIFKALDEVRDRISSVLVEEKIENPDIDYDNYFILPSSALVSKNLKAIENYTKAGINSQLYPNDLHTSYQYSQNSINLDPTCSNCYSLTANIDIAQGNKTEASKNLKKAIKYGVSLPKRMQFFPKEMYYRIENNTDALIKLLELKKDIFPYDFQPYQMLLENYKINFGIEKSKALMQEAIDNGNVEKGLLALYYLQLENQDYEDAKSTLDRFSNDFPERDQDRMRYADLYEKQGNLKEARKILLKEETLDPFNTKIQIKLSYLDFKDQKVKSAYDRLDKGIEESTTLTDSLTFIKQKYNYAFYSGEISKALSLIKNYEDYASKKTPIINVIAQNLQIKTLMHMSINQLDNVEKEINNVGQYLPQYKSTWVCNAQNSAIVLEYPILNDNKGHEICDQILQNYGEGFIEYFQLLQSFLKQDYKSCIEILEEKNKALRKIMNADFFVAEIYHKNGQTDKAIEILSQVINRKPENPLNYLKMAELLSETDDNEAKKYIEIVNKYYKDADDNFIPLQRLKKLKEGLSSQTL